MFVLPLVMHLCFHCGNLQNCECNYKQIVHDSINYVCFAIGNAFVFHVHKCVHFVEQHLNANAVLVMDNTHALQRQCKCFNGFLH